jgi:serine/threonine protein kinase/ketosteroid isomerase-like protein
MECPNCHRSLREGAQFCTACGVRTEHGGRSPLADSVPTAEPRAGARPNAGEADSLTGRVLDGKYEILARLGEGGMGSVYRARRVHIGDEVAVKVLHSKFVNDETLVERFRREARAAAQLQHPNVVTIHDYGEARGPEGFAYIVMELVRGLSLRELLRREGPLEVGRAAALMRDICAGVGAAHRRDIVHRDLKPDNIIVLPPEVDGDGERVKVVDFGIAKLRDMAGDSTLTQAGAMVGTPFYMSPEQCRGEQLDARADVYSLGALLYEMLAGQPPFTAASITGVISKHLTEPPPLVPDSLKVPPALQRTINRALAKDPEGRQRDASEFAREVLAAAADAARTAQMRSAATEPLFSDSTTPAPVTPMPVAVQQTGAQPHVRTHSQPHTPQTFGPPPQQQTRPPAPARQSSTGRVLLILGAIAFAVAGLVVLALLGFYWASQENTNNVAANSQNARTAQTPANSNANTTATPSKEDAALADRLAVAEQKILSGVGLTQADVADLSPADLRVLRQVPFARHGRIFSDARLQSYFESRPWYKPNPKFSESVLTPIDRTNIEFVRVYESGGPTPTPVDATTAVAQIAEALDDWAETTNGRDISAHMSHYAPTLETYYLKQNVPATQVRAERGQAFGRFDQMEVELANVQIVPDATGTRATVTLDKKWTFESDERSSTGAVKQQLTLARVGGRWLIVGERDLQVYYSNSEER